MAVSRNRPLTLALTVAVLLLPLLILGVLVARYLEFRTAMDGDAGTSGVAVVEQAHVAGSNDETCVGAFTPDGGGPAVEVDIEVDGRCVEGEQVPAVLVEPAVFHPGWWGRPTAWGPGTGTGEHLAPVIVVGLFIVLPVGAVAWIFRKPLLRSFTPRR
jgi:hypothetical protein